MGIIHNYYQFAGETIASAVGIYSSNKYPPNVHTSHSSPRMEALTFLHSELFRMFSHLANREPSELLGELNVEPVSPLCACESCRTDYRAEARIVGDSQRFRFSNGDQHIVYWRGDSISRIRPVSSDGVPASQYLENYQTT